MVKRGLGIDERLAHRLVADRLRAQAQQVRVDPPPSLRGRTLAALHEASGTGTTPGVIGLPGARIAAGLALLLLGMAAILHLRTPAPPSETVLAPRAFESFERRLRELETPWEMTLVEEARGLATDARHAGEYLLAQLPVLATYHELADR